MILKNPIFEGITVYIVSRDAVFSRMLELELSDAGMNAVRAEEFPSDSSELRIFAASTEVIAEAGGRFAHVEFGFSDGGSGRSERYFKRPFITEELVRAVSELVLASVGGESLVSEFSSLSVARNAESEESAASDIGLTYDSEQDRFSYNGELLSFTETEHALLSLLYENRGCAVTREDILARVFGRS